jgi:uroporphyrinogen-III synthase
MMAMTSPAQDVLSGRTIVVPETRELDLFAHMLEARGAATIRCPLVAILDHPDPAPIEAWLRRFNAGGCDDLILLTGEGLRRLLSVARRAEIDGEFIARLGQIRKITRGPKPAKALREIGLQSDLAAETPTTAGVIAALTGQELRGRRIGVQLYPDNPNQPLMDFIAGASASADPVLPYVYASAVEDAQVVALLERLAGGTVDAIAFTSTPQLRRLVAVAGTNGKSAMLREGLARTRIAAVGPAVAAEIEKLGVRVAIVPQGSFFMKPLVNAIADSFSSK